MCGHETRNGFRDHIMWIINEFLHFVNHSFT
ncbi:hypothetical protein NCPHL90_01174 [Corynebacterium diphtheriae]|nr:hypothetical protein NCPHL90_01174 [Corynebacterium diphtheriae]